MFRQDLILKIVEIVLSLAIIILCRYIIPYFKQLSSNKKFDSLMKWIEVAVKAAEITIVTPTKDEDGNTIKTGSTKKAFVINFLQDILMKLGLDLSDEEVDALIESSVENLHIELQENK